MILLLIRAAANQEVVENLLLGGPVSNKRRPSPLFWGTSDMYGLSELQDWIQPYGSAEGQVRDDHLDGVNEWSDSIRQLKYALVGWH
jgi:hypothetical protein